ncbi:unnamed protein product [Symbiodinium microadriaticum]|nr:unnamed protein product [Symbiodinium microadriaticum]
MFASPDDDYDQPSQPPESSASPAKPTGAGSGSKPSAGFDADSDKLHPASEPNNSPRKDLSQLLEDVDAAAATPKRNASDTASVAAAAAPAEQMPPAPPHGDASLLCTMCGKRAKAAKQKFCSLCRSDVQACQRDAEAHEQGEWFKTLQKQGGADFEDLVFEYVKKQTATRRKYSQRCKFDFLRYKEAVRVKSAFRLGHKAIFMHKSRAIQHWCERLGIDRREASLKWDVEVEKAKHKLMTGPKESPLTIPVKIDDFLVFENAIEHEKSKESEFKQQKYKDETSQMMDEALEGAANTDWHRYGLDMPADSSDLVNSVFGRSARLTAPSASSASALQSSEEQQEPPPKKTKAFDSGTERNAVLTKLTTNLGREIQGLQAMQDEAQAFLQDPDFVAANGDKELANHERQSTSLLNARIRLSLAFLGSYRPGKELPSKEIIDADAKAYEVLSQTVLKEPSDFEGLDWAQPFVIRLGDSALPKSKAVLEDSKVKSCLESFYNGFPGSAAALQGSKRFTRLLQESKALRDDVLQELGVQEFRAAGDADTLFTAADSLAVFGYGEDMQQHGLETLQLPSLRWQVQGHRHVIMMPLEAVVSYLKSCRKGERVHHKDVVEFVSAAQPSSLASFLSFHPDALCHALLGQNSVAYLPPGWILAEKVVNAKCVYGVRMLWIPKLASDRNLEAAADWVGDAAEGANASKGLAAVYRQWQQTVDREKKAAEAARLQLEQDAAIQNAETHKDAEHIHKKAEEDAAVQNAQSQQDAEHIQKKAEEDARGPAKNQNISEKHKASDSENRPEDPAKAAAAEAVTGTVQNKSEVSWCLEWAERHLDALQGDAWTTLRQNLEAGVHMITRFSGMDAPSVAAKKIEDAVQKRGLSLRKQEGQGIVLCSAADKASAPRACLHHLAKNVDWAAHGPSHIFGDLEESVTPQCLAELRKIAQQSGQLQADEGKNFIRQLLKPLLEDGGLKDSAPCALHPDQECPLNPDIVHGALRIHVAGSPCIDFSRRGKRQGAAGPTAVVFAIWMAHFLRSNVPILIHENTPDFPDALLLDPLHYFGSRRWKMVVFNLCPTMFNIPAKRQRRYSVVWDAGRISFGGSYKEFVDLWVQECDKKGGIFFRAGQAFSGEESKTKHQSLAKYNDIRVDKMLQNPRNEAWAIGDLSQRPPWGSLEMFLPTLTTGSQIYHLGKQKYLTASEALESLGFDAETPAARMLKDGSLSDAQVRSLAGNTMALSSVGTVLLYVLSRVKHVAPDARFSQPSSSRQF